MRICCPECNFSRMMDETKVPPTAQVATCPHCKTRFKFREIESCESFSENKDIDSINEPQPGNERQEGEYSNYAEDSFAEDRFSGSEADANNNHGKRQPPSAPTAPPSLDNEDKKSGPWEKIVSFGKKWTSEEGRDAAPSTFQNKDTGQSSTEEIPWENPQRYGYLTAFYITILNVLGHGPRFFSLVTASGNIARPVIFFIILKTFQDILDIFWLKLFMPFILSSAPPNETTAWARAAIEKVTFAQVIFTPVTAVITIFVLVCVITMMLFFMNAQGVSLQKNIRIVSYSGAGLAFAVLPFVGIVVGFSWMILSSIQGIYSVYNIPKSKAFVITVPAYLLLFGIIIALSNS